MQTNMLWAGLLAFGLTCHAAEKDTAVIRAPQIPILTDRTDNVLFEISIPAQAGDTLHSLDLQIDADLDEIQHIRLYYAGIEAPSRKGSKQTKPVSYLSSHQIFNTRKANPSYSILKDEVSQINPTIRLKAEQPLGNGNHYFWVSLEMNRNTPLEKTVSASIRNIRKNRDSLSLSGDQETGIRRLGLGVRHAWDDQVAAYRIPGLITTQKGTLIGTYDIRYNSSVDLQEWIDIGVSRSTDNGQTWEPMRVAMSMGEAGGLPKAQNGIGDPSVLFDDRTNTIWIAAAWTHGMGNERAWWNSMPGMDTTETAQLMLTKSTDDGKTWSQPVNITSQVKDPSWYFLLQGPGRGITMKDGTLVFPIQYIDSTRVPNAGIMYSKDHGKNWHLHTAARSNTTEAQVAEIEPGVLMLNMRDNRGGSRAVAITKDLGKTWSEHPSSRKLLQEPVCMASLLKIEAKDNCLNRDILLFSNPNTTTGRNHLTIKASLDNGLSWPEKYQILLDEEENWGYSCLTLIDRETVGILYESSVAHITFQKVKLRDLIPQ